MLMDATSHIVRQAAPKIRPKVYLWAGVIATLLALVGFWPTYFGPLFAGRLNATRIVHVHAVVQVLWLALFLTQITLAATGHIAQHLRLGKWLFLLGAIVIVLGLAVSFASFGAQIAHGETARAQRRLFGFFRDIGIFVPFLAAGWIYRNRPEIHKRSMIAATTMLLLPAVSRMTFLGAPVPLWKFMLIWPVPIYICMIYDFVSKRRIHIVYVLAVMVMLTARLILPFGRSQTWAEISGWFVQFYQAH